MKKKRKNSESKEEYLTVKDQLKMTARLVLPYKYQKIFGVGGFCYGSVGLHETTKFFVGPY